MEGAILGYLQFDGSNPMTRTLKRICTTVLLVGFIAGMRVPCLGQLASTHMNLYSGKHTGHETRKGVGPTRWLPRPEYPLSSTDIQLRQAKLDAGNSTEYSSWLEGNHVAKAEGIDPPIGLNWRANETINGTPPDNSIAISNGGIVVSADNNSLDYFNDSGDSLLRVRLDTLLKDTIFSQAPFDPMVEYDFEHDRFFIAFVHGFHSSVSKMVLLVSKTNDPRDGWWEYGFQARDSANSDKWLDYATIGHNRENIFVACLLLRDSTNSLVGNRMTRISIQSVLNGGNPQYAMYYNVRDGNGNIATAISPSSIGQIGDYSGRMFFVSSEGFGGNQVHLYKFHQGGVVDTIESFAVNTSAYSIPLDANQLGSTQLLRTGDCKVRSSFYLNGQVHYVFSSDIGQGFCGISYNRIDVSSMTNTRDTWGLSGTFAYGYPSVASFGTDSTDPSVMICFLRSGQTIYPQVCVVNYDGSWSPNSKIVHNGQGPVDISPGDLERWGDRTGICRRFNALDPGIWLSGHFGAGPAINQYGVDSSWTTWVAEIGDGRTVTSPPQSINPTRRMVIFPNPTQGSVSIELQGEFVRDQHILIMDLAGQVVREISIPVSGKRHFLISLEASDMHLPSGTYFVHHLEYPTLHEKLVVLR